jgi:hypothetical protein
MFSAASESRRKHSFFQIRTGMAFCPENNPAL